MGRAVLRLTVVVAALLGLAAPAMAGGFATVRLDQPPGEVYVEVPWSFGFMVRQHDVTPINEVEPVVRARHKESGEEVRADARQDGEVGHFVAKLTFPRQGAWKWAIEPAPFPETSFETLLVLAGPSAAAAQATQPQHPASIQTGTCAAGGEVAFPLEDVVAGPWQTGAAQLASDAADASALPIAVSVTTVGAGLDEIVAASHSITVQKSAEDAETDVACGDVTGQVVGDELVVGLQQLGNSGDVGVAVLRADGASTEVTLYLLAVAESAAAPIAAAPSGSTATVEIVGPAFDVVAFRPETLTVAAGTTVTWTNTSPDPHTITGDDLAFEDSGLLDPGQSFSQTFDRPGTYRYRCGPHPWMEGIVVVE